MLNLQAVEDQPWGARESAQGGDTVPCPARQREALVQRFHTPIQVCWRCLETTVLHEGSAVGLMKAAQKWSEEVRKNRQLSWTSYLKLQHQRIKFCTGMRTAVTICHRDVSKTEATINIGDRKVWDLVKITLLSNNKNYYRYKNWDVRVKEKKRESYLWLERGNLRPELCWVMNLKIQMSKQNDVVMHMTVI
jgi:hypothetical protein